MKTICAMIIALSLCCSQAPSPQYDTDVKVEKKEEPQSRHDFYNLLTGAIVGMFIYQWVK